MIAIVLAAGLGSRLGALTAHVPKALVSLAGRSLLARQVDVMHAVGIRDVTIVTGHRRERIDALGYPTRHNPRYPSTNMVASLFCATDRLRSGDDVLVTYGDIVYEPRVLRAALSCCAPLATVVDRSWHVLWSARGGDPLETAETLRIDSEGFVRELGKKPRRHDEIEGQYVGISRFSAAFARELVDIYGRIDPADHFDGRPRDEMCLTSLLQHLIDEGRRLTPIWIDGGWLEVDTRADLEAYERLHRERRLAALCALD